jgi:hypothetical protein
MGCDVDDLKWVRWRLDRLAAARLLGPLAAELEADYQFFVVMEHELMLEQARCSGASSDSERTNSREHEAA